MSAERAARAALLERWQTEEDIAHIHGWDFSHIEGRYTEETDLPWSYEQTVRRYLTPEARLLDVDTGGGEFLLSLGHPHRNTAAMEIIRPTLRCAAGRSRRWTLSSAPGAAKAPIPSRTVHSTWSSTATAISAPPKPAGCSAPAGCSSLSRWARKTTGSL